MANLDFVYNPAEHEAQTGGEVLPVQDCIAQITASDYKPTKNAQGKYIEFEYTIIEGLSVGRKFWERLNVQNKNQQTVDIANAALKSILVAAGKDKEPFTDTTSVHNIPMRVKITVTPRKIDGQLTGENQNAFKYSPLNAAAPQAAQSARSTGGAAGYVASAKTSTDATTLTAPGGAPGVKKKPWEK